MTPSLALLDDPLPPGNLSGGRAPFGPAAILRGPEDLVRFYREAAGSAPLLVVTNREPVVWKGEGCLSLPPGGVSQTIHRLLSRTGGRWIALRDSGGPDGLRVPGEEGDPGYRLDRMDIPPALMEGHYAGFSTGLPI